MSVQPELFRWARARSGIEEDVWGKRFPKYNVWLSGDARPTLTQLEEFARKTYTPVGFLLLDEPPAEQVPIPDFRTVGDLPIGAVDQQVTADLLDTVYVCQARQEWFRDHQLLNGEAPLELLRENAEAAGVLVMVSGIVGSNTHRKLDPEQFRGFALADPYAPTVFVNGADSKTAQFFTPAHELAHLWLGSTGLSDLDPQSGRAHAEERWCNAVAAELLVPMNEFRSMLDHTLERRDQLDGLAERFMVSTQVILGRMREAGLMSWDQFMAALREEKARFAEFAGGQPQASSGGNFYNTKPVQVGKRFARELIASTLEGHTPYTEAFRLLNVKKTSTFNGLGAQLGVI